YHEVDPDAAGLVREPVTIEVDLGGETVSADVYRKEVGSVPLYLLECEWVTDALYGGDREHRIRQEMLLGVGSVRALAGPGIEPTVYHLNEGHSAFLALERIRTLVEQGTTTADAIDEVRRSTIFTTHTPVPAGNEVFAEELVIRYAGRLAEDAGITGTDLLALGRHDSEPGFGLTPFALRMAAHANGVSRLHGEVARGLWTSLWADRGGPPPIGYVTNGVHLGTWLDPALADLLRAAGVRPEAEPTEGRWELVADIDSESVWRVHQTA